MIARILLGLAAICTVFSFTGEAQARRHHYQHVTHRSVPARQVTNLGIFGCMDNSGRWMACGTSTSRPAARRNAARTAFQTTTPLWQPATSNEYEGEPRGAGRSKRAVGGIAYIPNPSGCSRTFKSCACRLAAYWGLGNGLDAVDTWPHRFARASGPGARVAVVRPGHIMGIEGGGPGAWRVVDFNSGDHLNRTYTVSSFPPGTVFVDTSSRRTAGGSYSAKRHHRRYASR